MESVSISIMNYQVVKKAVVMSFVFWVGVINCFAKSPAKSVKKGNHFYQLGKFDEALKMYEQAQVDAPDSAIVNFNMGTVWYKKGDYKKAIEMFNKSLITENKKLEAKAAYNIGNSKYRLGKLKQTTDLSLTINLWKEALDYYKRAMELDAKNLDAKYNYELVERELKALLDKFKPHQKEQKEFSKKKQGQNKENKNQPSSASKQASPKKGKKEKKEKEEEKKSVEAGSNQKEKTAGFNKEKEQKEISQKEAEMILRGYAHQERSWGKIKRKGKGYYPQVEKDW
ncbi:MAG: hypothetical protein B6D56_01350 [Candidatus Omnitrophica bacterium 4484_70.1]|nr:MAG: hypothetical protein B6D56_01350 [Candidatus Omnitrophica bacterium 4484_70.1]